MGVPAKEYQFQQSIIQLAEWNKWMVYHVTNVRGRLRSPTSVGFPDLVLLRGSRIIFAELKTEKGKLTKAQVRWIDSLKEAGQKAVVWRPQDWDEICRILT